MIQILVSRGIESPAVNILEYGDYSTGTEKTVREEVDGSGTGQAPNIMVP